jgi:hypothetical protein
MRRIESIPAGRMDPPDTLRPNARRIWEEIQRGKPNFYSEFDRVPLMLYCVTAAEMEAIASGELEVTMEKLKEVTARFNMLGKNLRLTKNVPHMGRHSVDAPAGGEVVGADVAPDGEAATPWARK